MNLIEYLESVVSRNTELDAITGKQLHMDSEMVKVSTDAGAGATGLQTWEPAHTEEEAAELAVARMKFSDRKITF